MSGISKRCSVFPQALGKFCGYILWYLKIFYLYSFHRKTLSFLLVYSNRVTPYSFFPFLSPTCCTLQYLSFSFCLFSDYKSNGHSAHICVNWAITLCSALGPGTLRPVRVTHGPTSRNSHLSWSDCYWNSKENNQNNVQICVQLCSTICNYCGVKSHSSCWQGSLRYCLLYYTTEVLPLVSTSRAVGLSLLTCWVCPSSV